MAQYKVPQDVEADDKLIGPFSWRQFVYLLIAAALIGLAVGLFQLFPLLAIIPVPFVLFFLVLALPLKKDQPMETYLAAVVTYYLKPHTRLWTPGQRESTILITAPKIVEDVRTRNITGEEATHRLSFLANIVDTEGYAIKGTGNNSVREDLIAEANTAPDMFDSYESRNLDAAMIKNQANQAIKQQEPQENAQAEMSRREAKRNEKEQKRAEEGKRIREEEERIREEERKLREEEQRRIQEEHARLEEERKRLEEERRKYEEELARQRAEHEAEIERMRGAIAKGNELEISDMTIKNQRGSIGTGEVETKKGSTRLVKNSIMELANNDDYTVATIAKEANRIKGKEEGEGEVFVSLH